MTATTLNSSGGALSVSTTLQQIGSTNNNNPLSKRLNDFTFVQAFIQSKGRVNHSVYKCTFKRTHTQMVQIINLLPKSNVNEGKKRTQQPVFYRFLTVERTPFFQKAITKRAVTPQSMIQQEILYALHMIESVFTINYLTLEEGTFIFTQDDAETLWLTNVQDLTYQSSQEPENTKLNTMQIQQFVDNSLSMAFKLRMSVIQAPLQPLQFDDSLFKKTKSPQSCPFCQFKLSKETQLDLIEDEEPHFEFTLGQLLSIQDPQKFAETKCRLSDRQKSQLGYFKMQSPLPLMVRLLYPDDLNMLLPKGVTGKGLEFLRSHDVRWALKTVQTCEICFRNVLETLKEQEECEKFDKAIMLEEDFFDSIMHRPSKMIRQASNYSGQRKIKRGALVEGYNKDRRESKSFMHTARIRRGGPDNESTRLIRPSVDFIDMESKLSHQPPPDLLSSYHSKSQSALIPTRNTESQHIAKRDALVITSLNDRKRRTALTSQNGPRQKQSLGLVPASFLESVKINTPYPERQNQVRSTIEATRKLVLSQLSKYQQTTHLPSNTDPLQSTITFTEASLPRPLLTVDKPWLLEHFQALQRAKMYSLQDVQGVTRVDQPKSARESQMEQMIKGHFSKALMERYRGESNGERVRERGEREKREVDKMRLKKYYLVQNSKVQQCQLLSDRMGSLLEEQKALSQNDSQPFDFRELEIKETVAKSRSTLKLINRNLLKVDRLGRKGKGKSLEALAEQVRRMKESVASTKVTETI
ncbi:hypothetical protein FGO68_gene1744 [Halteria grandinella]|uniref:Uncharacterized protein n=1 Tax=Halteria grandinella TaxID=5974 RepID=A0A8J8P181_HALGN|nr:hypothetical protein FGO68_gene1744 [Halteria grandinella]